MAPVGYLRTTPPALQLAVAPARRVFGPRELDKLHAYLTEDDRQIRLWEVSRPTDLLFDSQARVQGRFRWTIAALREFCHLLSPGLALLVRDIGGLDSVAESPTSASLILRLLNDLMKLRFTSSLAGCRLVLHMAGETIEGIVGPRYQAFANREILGQTERLSRALSLPAFFQSAVTTGRILQLRYRSISPLFSLSGAAEGDAFYAGFQLVNAQLGRAALQASPLLFREQTNSVALAPELKGARIVHIRRHGGHLAKALGCLLDRVDERTPRLSPLEEGLRKLQRTPLGPIPATIKAGTAWHKLHKRLSRRLPPFVTMALFRQTAMWGSELPSEGPPPYQGPACRTGFDFFNAVINLAQQSTGSRQRKLERLGFELAEGDFPLDLGRI